ncbi:MAG: TRAP transporter small permease [Desulfobacterales bacterium]|jgi:TRAP-type C4-dicarboxylate transport system permease small subunit|nr:TRAP transporter small permease [Desulfobacterales bacterium]
MGGSGFPWESHRGPGTAGFPREEDPACLNVVGLNGASSGSQSSEGGVFMPSLIRGIDQLSLLLARAAAVFLVLMALLILAEIFLWNLFGATTLIAEEYSSYLMAGMIFFGAGYCLREKGHIRISLLLHFLPLRLSRFLDFLACLVSTLFMGYLWWYLYKMLASAWRYSSMSGTLTRTPLSIPMMIVLLGATGFFFQLVAETFKTLQSIGYTDRGDSK